MLKDSPVNSQIPIVTPDLLQRWEQLFHYYDVDDDGLWTCKDLEIQKERVMKGANLTPEKYADVMKLVTDSWVNGFGIDQTATLNLEQFISHTKGAYLDGTLSKIIKVVRERMFSCCDLDGDGLIDYNEFIMGDGAMGRSDMSHFRKAFDAIDKDHSGKITKEEYVKAYVKYLCDPFAELENIPLFGIPRSG